MKTYNLPLPHAIAKSHNASNFTASALQMVDSVDPLASAPDALMIKHMSMKSKSPKDKLPSGTLLPLSHRQILLKLFLKSHISDLMSSSVDPIVGAIAENLTVRKNIVNVSKLACLVEFFATAVNAKMMRILVRHKSLCSKLNALSRNSSLLKNVFSKTSV